MAWYYVATFIGSLCVLSFTPLFPYLGLGSELTNSVQVVCAGAFFLSFQIPFLKSRFSSRPVKASVPRSHRSEFLSASDLDETASTPFLPLGEGYRIILSSEDRDFHKEVVGFLREVLERELQANVEIIQKFTAEGTLNYIMENRVDLILIDQEYKSTEMGYLQLVRELRTAQTPIAVFSRNALSGEEQIEGISGSFVYPLTVPSVKALSRLIRKHRKATANSRPA